METKNTFEDWFHQLEYFSLKSERFFGDCEHYLKDDDELQRVEGEKILFEWLRAAFEAGWESGKKA
jgi:hypothetical protein